MKAKNTPISKTLRKQQTPWENTLWRYLRAKRTWDLKIKRQVPILNYVVDFCCQSKKLIIELDGGGHTNQSNKIKDFERDQKLAALGYKILRFWNNDIDNNLEAVIETIEKNLFPTSPQPSPTPGEGD